MARRKSFSPEFKRRVAEEAIAEANVSLVARRYGIHRSMVTRWMEDLKEGQLDSSWLSASTMDQILRENRELKRLLGEKELELKVKEELLKKTLQRSGTR
jgi:transposase